MIKVGDKVRVVRNDPQVDSSFEEEGVEIGMVGTVRSITVGDSVCPIEVEFELSETYSRGDSLGFSEYELELIDE